MRFGTGNKGVLTCTSVTAAIALVLSGCGSGSSNGSNNSGSGKVDGTITFQTWNLKADHSKYFKHLIKDFESKHPKAHVKWQDQPAEDYAKKIQSQVTTHKLPDVVNTAPDLAYPLAKAGALVNVAKQDSGAKKKYMSSAWDSLTYKDPKGTYSYPWYLNTGPNFYDKSLFKKGGLNPKKPPTTYDQMLDDAVKYGKHNKGQHYLWGNMPAIADFALYGVPLMNKDHTKFTFATDKAEKFVDKYKDAYDAHGFLPAGLSMEYTGVGKAFMSGKVAMNSGSAYDLQNFKHNAPKLAKHLGVSSAFTNTGTYDMSAQSLSVSKNSDHMATAQAFAKFVTNEKNQMAFAKKVNVFPSTAHTLKNSYFSKRDGTKNTEIRVNAAKQLKKARSHEPVQFNDEMEKYLQQQLSDAMKGKQSSHEALKKAEDKCNQLLQG